MPDEKKPHDPAARAKAQGQKLAQAVAGHPAGAALIRVFTDRKTRPWAWVTVVAVALVVIVRACADTAPRQAIAGKPVQTAVAVTKDAPVYIESFGTLTPPQDVNVKSQVEGQIKEVHFTEGQDIKAGDLLFTIDPSTYAAGLAKAEAQVAQDLADLNLKRTTLERNKKLLADQLISQQDYDRYTTDVTSAEARLRLDTAAAEQAKINLDYCYIKSPIDGRAGKRLVDIGNIVPANTGPVLVNIKTIEEMYVDFTIPERQLPLIRRTMDEGDLKVEFAPQGEEQAVYTGTLQFLDNAVDSATGTVLLRAIVENRDRKLWAGQFVTVRLILGVEKLAVLVPGEAVQLGQKGEYVFVVTPEKKAELRLVTTGNRQGELVVIKSGVAAGDRVVTAGQLGLSPGAAILDLSAEAAGAKGK